MKIANSTIQKLNAQELNDMQCFSIGIILITRGSILKKRVKVDGKFINLDKMVNSFCYNIGSRRFEFVPLIDGGYAYRVFNKETEAYEKHVTPTQALWFIK